MLRKFLVLGLAMALSVPALPAAAGSDQTANFAILYGLDSTDPIYCVVTGNNGNPFGGPIQGLKNITTTGSSATTDAVTASDAPFKSVVAGDLLMVAKPDGTTLLRVVISKASNDQVVVNSAWDLSQTGGWGFTYLKTICGTAATDGWIDVSNADSFDITFELDQVNATGGVNVQVQCMTAGVNASPVQVFPACTSGSCNTVQNYATAGVAGATTVAVSFPYQKCRVAVDIATADDGDDLTTNEERIDISITKHLSSR